jgi:hypothetical protein
MVIIFVWLLGAIVSAPFFLKSHRDGKWSFIDELPGDLTYIELFLTSMMWWMFIMVSIMSIKIK